MSTATETEPIVGELVVSVPKQIPIEFNVGDKRIAELRQKWTGLVATDKASYELITKGIREVREERTGVESSRKDLKQYALEYGRRVDAEARRLTEELESIENPLKAEKAKFDEAKEAEKRKIEAAKQAALELRIQKLIAVECVPHSLIVEAWSQEQFETELAVATKAFEAKKAKEAEQAAEAARVAAEQAEALRVEQEKLAAERAELDRLRAEEAARQKAEADKRRAELEAIESQQRAEREKLESERKAFETERERVAKIERDRLEAERLKAGAIENERLAKIAAEAEAKRLEALKPDAEKLQVLADTLRLLSYPEMSTKEGRVFLGVVIAHIESIARDCESFIVS